MIPTSQQSITSVRTVAKNCTHQLLTCRIVRPVSWASCFFCSSDGYGCWKIKRKVSVKLKEHSDHNISHRKTRPSCDYTDSSKHINGFCASIWQRFIKCVCIPVWKIIFHSEAVPWTSPVSSWTQTGQTSPAHGSFYKLLHILASMTNKHIIWKHSLWWQLNWQFDTLTWGDSLGCSCVLTPWPFVSSEMMGHSNTRPTCLIVYGTCWAKPQLTNTW